MCDESKQMLTLCRMPGSGTSLVDTFGTTPDGSCGGSQGYTCGVLYGNCCGKDNKCGSTMSECGVGWYVLLQIPRYSVVLT